MKKIRTIEEKEKHREAMARYRVQKRHEGATPMPVQTTSTHKDETPPLVLSAPMEWKPASCPSGYSSTHGALIRIMESAASVESQDVVNAELGAFDAITNGFKAISTINSNALKQKEADHRKKHETIRQVIAAIPCHPPDNRVEEIKELSTTPFPSITNILLGSRLHKSNKSVKCDDSFTETSGQYE